MLRSVSDDVADTKPILQNSLPSPELAACLEELLPAYPERFVEVGRAHILDDYGAGTSFGDTLRVFKFRP